MNLFPINSSPTQFATPNNSEHSQSANTAAPSNLNVDPSLNLHNSTPTNEMVFDLRTTINSAVEILDWMVSYYGALSLDTNVSELSPERMFKLYYLLWSEKGPLWWKTYAVQKKKKSTQLESNADYSSSEMNEFNGRRKTERAFIYVPRQGSPNKVQFVPVSKCVWQDDLSICEMIDSDLIVLSRIYGDLPDVDREVAKRLFMDAGVSEIPPLDLFVTALIVSAKAEPDTFVFNRSVFILSTLVQMLYEDGNRVNLNYQSVRCQLVSSLRMHRILPSHRLEWVNFSEKIVIMDDYALARRLDELNCLDGIHFVGSWADDSGSGVPRPPVDKVAKFLQSNSVPQLSDIVEVRKIGKNELPPEEFVKMVQKWIYYIQSYLYTRDRERFMRLAAGGVVEAVNSIEIQVWSSLKVVYAVCGEDSDAVGVDNYFECLEVQKKNFGARKPSRLRISRTAIYVFNFAERVLKDKKILHDVIGEFVDFFFEGERNAEAANFVTLCVDLSMTAPILVGDLLMNCGVEFLPSHVTTWSLNVGFYDEIDFGELWAGIQLADNVGVRKATELWTKEARKARQSRRRSNTSSAAHSSQGPVFRYTRTTTTTYESVPEATEEDGSFISVPRECTTFIRAHPRIRVAGITKVNKLKEPSVPKPKKVKRGIRKIDLDDENRYWERLEKESWDTNEVGYAGELLVYMYLLSENINQPEKYVEWMNGDVETGGPYDIRVVNVETGEADFFEVKTRRSGVSPAISNNEKKFADLNESKYLVYVLGNITKLSMDRFSPARSGKPRSGTVSVDERIYLTKYRRNNGRSAMFERKTI